MTRVGAESDHKNSSARSTETQRNIQKLQSHALLTLLQLG